MQTILEVIKNIQSQIISIGSDLLMPMDTMLQFEKSIAMLENGYSAYDTLDSGDNNLQADIDQIKEGSRIQIPVNVLEFTSNGNTIWVQSPRYGGTILRIKSMGKIKTETCKNSPTSHSDLIIPEDISFCISNDATIL